MDGRLVINKQDQKVDTLFGYATMEIWNSLIHLYCWHSGIRCKSQFGNEREKIISENLESQAPVGTEMKPSWSLVKIIFCLTDVIYFFLCNSEKSGKLIVFAIYFYPVIVVPQLHLHIKPSHQSHVGQFGEMGRDVATCISWLFWCLCGNYRIF